MDATKFTIQGRVTLGKVLGDAEKVKEKETPGLGILGLRAVLIGWEWERESEEERKRQVPPMMVPEKPSRITRILLHGRRTCRTTGQNKGLI